MLKFSKLIFISFLLLISAQTTFAGRYYDSATGRWITVDPKAVKYPGWSPYNYVMDNPIKNIDPDGKDVYVLNNSTGARIIGIPFGHNAMLIGNKEFGYTYYSKDGLKGNTVRYFSSMENFNKSDISKEYDRKADVSTS